MTDQVEQGGAATRRRRRMRRWTRRQTDSFLDTLAATANVAEAARVAGVTPATAYGRKQRDAAFAAAWTQALDIGFCELELLLLRHSLHGSPRIERVVEGADGTVKQVKTVHAYPLAFAMRLLSVHRGEVERHRLAQATGRDRDDAAVMARVRAEVARVRERLGLDRRDDDA